MVKKNKKGWIKVMEAFIAIAILLAVLLLIVQNEKFEAKEISKINKMQDSFLKKVQINDSLRNEILQTDELPVQNNETGFPEKLNESTFDEFAPSIHCDTKICNHLENCYIEIEKQQNIYVKSLIILANNTEYNPKNIVLSCYTN